jgi:hypothetical protein
MAARSSASFFQPSDLPDNAASSAIKRKAGFDEP